MQPMTRTDFLSLVIALVLAVTAGVVLTNCDDDDDDASDELVLSDACPRGIVTAGMGLRWQRVNHRMSLWRMAPFTGTCPQVVPDDAFLSAAYVGGPWSTGQTATDTPTASYRYWSVDAPGMVGFAQKSVTITIDAPDDSATADAAIDLAETDMEGFDDYAILLAGLELTTDVPQVDPAYPVNYDPQHGYTSRGIGAGVMWLDVSGGVARFSAWARFAHGEADRPPMNQAIPRARTQATVHALLVGVNRGAITETAHGYFLEYDDPRLLLAPDYDHAPAALRALTIDGEPGFDVAFAGLTAFDFDLFGSVEKGDYIREFSVDVKLTGYDAETGIAQFDVDGFASNIGLLTYERMENDFSADVALIQVPAGTAQQRTIKEPFATGETLLGLR
jgi:hypothetical protein